MSKVELKTIFSPKCDVRISNVCDDKSIISRLDAMQKMTPGARNICSKCFIYTWNNPTIVNFQSNRNRVTNSLYQSKAS
jgi:hypothetical protein